MPDPLVVFSHGQESGPWGGKIRHLAEIASARGCRVISVDYRGIQDPDQRVGHLLAQDLGRYDRLILTGSSMGGYVSAAACDRLGADGVFLLAPAIQWGGLEVGRLKGKARVFVAHGWTDDDIPVDSAFRFARENRAELHLFDDGHRLLEVLPALGRLFALFLDEILTE